MLGAHPDGNAQPADAPPCMTPDSTIPTATPRLSVARKLLYGAGQAAPGLAENSINIFLLFYYTKVVQLDPGLVGIALMVGRFWDAFTDPLMGYISDQTRTRWGRRRPFILFGAVPFGLAYFLLWAPFAGIMGKDAFPYLIVVFLLYSTCVTICQVPYLTLGGELSSDYHERSSIIGFRQIFWIITILIGGALTANVVMLFVDAPYGDVASRSGWGAMAALFGALGTCAWLTAGFGTREVVEPGPRATTSTREALLHIFGAALDALRNPHFRKIAGTFLIAQIAFVMTTSTLPFLINDWMLKPQLFAPIMGSLLIAAIPCLGLWVRLSRRIGKRVAYLAGLGILAALPLTSLYALHPERWVGYSFIYAAIFGVGLASHMVFPWSLIPDTIDVEELKQGKRNDGSYFGVMTFLGKSSSAISIFIASQMIELVGYDKTLEFQSASTLQGLRTIYAVVPAIAFLAAAFIFSRYSLTEKGAHEVRAQLHERRGDLDGAGG